MHLSESELVFSALLAQAHQLEVLRMANIRQHVWIVMLEAVRPSVTGSQTGGVPRGSQRSEKVKQKIRSKKQPPRARRRK